MADTWNIKEGYPLDCACNNFDQTENLLQDVIDLLEDQALPLTQTIVQTVSGGTIPAGVQSYTIVNLGIDPTDPSAGRNSMLINGVVWPTDFIEFGNSSDSSHGVLANAITYDPNGNTLLVVYNLA